MIEGSGSGSIPLTNGSRSGSMRPKNMWIRWMRIRNTAARGGGGPPVWPEGCTCRCWTRQWCRPRGWRPWRRPAAPGPSSAPRRARLMRGDSGSTGSYSARSWSLLTLRARERSKKHAAIIWPWGSFKRLTIHKLMFWIRILKDLSLLDPDPKSYFQYESR